MTGPLARYLTKQDIADTLQVSPGTVQKAVRDGELHCIRFGNRVRFSPDEVAAWLAKKGGQ